MLCQALPLLFNLRLFCLVHRQAQDVTTLRDGSCVESSKLGQLHYAQMPLPLELQMEDYPTPRALSKDEIPGIIDAFRCGRQSPLCVAG